MTPTIQSRYETLVAAGEIRRDQAQLAVIAKLEDIRLYLEATSQRPKSLLKTLFSNRKPECPPGLYLWGGVGVGKSMLMDLFFAATEIDRKRRVHFHAFMQEIHDAMQKARDAALDDPLATVAQGVADHARLLCFDEMQISDITDAMIIGRLFEQLFAAGVTIVTTSNRPPDDLYKDGLNRQLFLPFIARIKARMNVHHLLSERDYRQDLLRGQQTYFTPDNAKAKAALDQVWAKLTGGNEAPLCLMVKARKVILPRFHNGVARATFSELCEEPLGAGDYLAIAAHTRVLVLDAIPRLSRSRNNEAKRFVTLIDTLYEAKTRLICTAAAVPEKLYVSGTGAFEFRRTASRLREMQAADWGRKSTA